ncbi:MAG: GTP 3',8-cyclase MoaA [Phycisphaerales bacterium]|nr:MAG: GTP 3',8-cyclase MoaA [Phycisphaerales bacterium]
MGVNCLRISVTDRCNLRCVYCRPQDDCDFIQQQEVLTSDEIHRVVKLFADCGVNRVRLTGGEPLMRKGIISLVARLAEIESVRELTLTTNGVLLEQMAGELRAAGLNRVNVSIDSLEASSYKRITGYDFSSKVVLGIRKAIEVGLEPVRINAVILRGINHSQVAALAGMSVDLPVTVRFIEYCPTGNDTQAAEDYMPYDEIRRVIEDEIGPLREATIERGNGPALYFKLANSIGAIGFISGRSTVFCESCNRLRVTSDGRIKPCLYSPQEYDIRKLIRAGAPDDQVREVLKVIISRKHAFTRLNSSAESFSMRKVGG